MLTAPVISEGRGRGCPLGVSLDYCLDIAHTERISTLPVWDDRRGGVSPRLKKHYKRGYTRSAWLGGECLNGAQNMTPSGSATGTFRARGVFGEC
jgi:hypothetical protein